MNHNAPQPPKSDNAGALADFLNQLSRRSALRPRTPLPEIEDDARQVGADADLAARFVETARGAGLRVQRAAADDWISPIREILSECGAKAVFVETAAARTAGFDVDQLMTALTRAGLTVHVDSSDETLFSVDAGITGVECAVAETGTLVCQSGAGRARGGSLIPPLHVALVRTTQILPDLCDCLNCAVVGPVLPANVNLITGPSKTADIEGILVTGVHGPREVHVILV